MLICALNEAVLGSGPSKMSVSAVGEAGHRDALGAQRVWCAGQPECAAGDHRLGLGVDEVDGLAAYPCAA